MHAELTRAHSKTKDDGVEMGLRWIVCRKSIKMYSKWRKSTVLVVQLRYCLLRSYRASKRQAGLQTDLNTDKTKIDVSAVSLALSQRTTNNLDEASIKAKNPQTSKYDPTFEVLCNNQLSFFSKHGYWFCGKSTQFNVSRYRCICGSFSFSTKRAFIPYLHARLKRMSYFI